MVPASEAEQGRIALRASRRQRMPFGNGLLELAYSGWRCESSDQMDGELIVKPVPGRPNTVARESV